MINNDVQNILNLLHEATKEIYLNIWIPSLRTFEFPFLQIKPLTINQQKQLIKTSLNQKNIFNSYDFTRECFNIIKENCKIYTEINIFDKLLILLNLRSNINNNYYLEDYEIFIPDIISNLTKEFNNNIEIFSQKYFIKENIKINVKLPSLETENLSEEYKNLNFYSKIKSDNQITEFLHELIIESLADELIKFIDKVEITDKIFNLSDFNYADRKSIIEKIPTELLSQILQYIADYKRLVESCLTINIEDKELKYLQIDGSFFSTIQ